VITKKRMLRNQKKRRMEAIASSISKGIVKKARSGVRRMIEDSFRDKEGKKKEVNTQKKTTKGQKIKCKSGIHARQDVLSVWRVRTKKDEKNGGESIENEGNLHMLHL